MARERIRHPICLAFFFCAPAGVQGSTRMAGKPTLKQLNFWILNPLKFAVDICPKCEKSLAEVLTDFQQIVHFGPHLCGQPRLFVTNSFMYQSLA